jgi:hypothetical protein
MDSVENSNSSHFCYQEQPFGQEAKILFLCVKIRGICKRAGFFNLPIGWAVAL